MRKSRDLIRQGAEKFGRLAEKLRSAPAADRDRITLRAAGAWLLVSEGAQALPFFEAVIARSDRPAARAEALAGAMRCQRQLRQPGELARLVALARAEMPRLGGSERETLLRAMEKAGQDR